MNKQEAQTLLGAEVEKWRRRSYTELTPMIDAEPTTLELLGESGTKYYAEIQAFWDAKPEGNIRLMVSLDDGGLRAFKPLCDSFIKAPDGSFVGEG